MQNANEVWGRNPADIIRENPDPLVIAGVYAQMIKDEETQFRMLQASENDAFAFARNFIYTYNEITRCIEIIPDYDYLRETVFPGLHSPGNRLWEKCQRMLVTISATAYFFAEWMTQDGFMAWMTSRKETKVDDGGGHSTWDSLFGKLRFYYEQMARRTPWAIEHFIGSVPRSDNLFKYMNAVNKTRNSVIYGEAPITTAPTGSGFVKALVDEAAVVPQLRSIHGNLMMACPNGTHYVSYPDGDGNHFAKVRNTEGHFSFEIVTLPYYLNPMHDEKWLADQERMLTKEEFGRRVMISYSTSVRGRVWPSFSRTNNTVVNLSFDPNALMCWFDFGFVDATSVGIVQIGKDEFGGEIKPVILVKAWLEVDHTKYKEVAKSLKGILRRLGYCGETRQLRCFGDPQVKQRSVATGKSLHDLYGAKDLEDDEGENCGFVIEAAPAHVTKAALDEIDKWFSDGRILIDSAANPIIKSAENWAWPRDTYGEPVPNATQPNHDRFSHAGKALEYGFAALFMKKEDGSEETHVHIERVTAEQVYANII